MNFPFYIARRYLFSKKSHHAINIISAISVCGVALATMALVCTMSVFNGFQDLVASFFTAIDPQLKVTPSQGKTMAADDPKLTALKAYPGIKIYTETLEDHALVICGEHQAMVTIKGVDDNFAQMADLNKLLYGDGTFTLHADVLEFGVLGIQLAAQLGLGASFDTPLRVYAPQKGERVNLSNPTESFTQSELYSPGVVFAVKQAKYDAGYILTSLRFARDLFGQQGRVSAIELQLQDGVDIRQAQADIQKILGKRPLRTAGRRVPHHGSGKAHRLPVSYVYSFSSQLQHHRFHLHADYRQERRRAHPAQFRGQRQPDYPYLPI